MPLFDFPHKGIRPLFDGGACAGGCDCLKVCSAVESDFRFTRRNIVLDNRDERNQAEAWGPIWKIFEGYATDPEIRFIHGVLSNAA